MRSDWNFTGASPRFQDYLQFDRALCHVLFDEKNAGLSLYLDMDEETFTAAAAVLGTGAEQFQSDMLKAIQKCLNVDKEDGSVFKEFESVGNWWFRFLKQARTGENRKPVPPPPVVGLLASFTLAAEKMGGNNEVAANAYYPHLREILNVPSDATTRFENAYRKVAERFWDALALWLEAEDGIFGLPSAFAISHRYVGLPVSQALIRDAEREKLKTFFIDANFPRATSISHSDMESALDLWISQQPSPASVSLKQLWAKADARNRIVDIALSEFLAWDGSDGVSGAGKSRATAPVVCSLFMGEVQDLFSSRIEVGFCIPQKTSAWADVEIQVSQGAIHQRLQPLGVQYFGATSSGSGISVKSLLEGDLRLSTSDLVEFRRVPRPIVPFVLDAISGLWVEVDRVQIGEISQLLVRSDEKYWGPVKTILEETARPGYEVQDSTGAKQAIEDGWILVKNLQVLATTTNEDARARADLNALFPRLGTHVSMNGGVRIPGRIQRWSQLLPPEITVTTDEAKPLTLSVTRRDLGLDQTQDSTILADGVLSPFTVDLAPFGLESGDYNLELKSGSTVLHLQTLRLRDSTIRDPYSWRDVKQLAHFESDPLWPINAIPADEADGDALIDGACVLTADVYSVNFTDELVTAPWWSSPQPPQKPPTHVDIPEVEATSCVVTGMHRWRIPTVHDVKTKEKYVTGTCTECRQQRRYPAQAWLAERSKHTTQDSTQDLSVRVLEISSIPQIKSIDGWRAVIDCLAYMGTGSGSDLSQLARQIENSPTFEREFADFVDQIGLVEINRTADGTVNRFEIAATALAEMSGGEALLTGMWATTSVTEALKSAGQLGGSAASGSDVVLPLVSGIQFDRLAEHLEIFAQKSAGAAMLGALPSLSQVASGLNEIPMPGWTSLERFNFEDGRWYPSNGDSEAGAFRVTNKFTRSYLIRTQASIERDKASLVTASLAKHLAANFIGRALVSFDAGTSTLRVPMGAQLPGLYGRAAVLCSGRKPHVEKSTFSLVYSEVSQEFAIELAEKLAS